MEANPPSDLFIGDHQGTQAIFYLRGDFLAVRSPEGQLLEQVPIAGGNDFRRLVSVQRYPSNYRVVLGSGSGHTPYTLVCVLDPTNTIVYHEVFHGNAYRLVPGVDVDADSVFEVWAADRWRYRFDRR